MAPVSLDSHHQHQPPPSVIRPIQRHAASWSLGASLISNSHNSVAHTSSISPSTRLHNHDPIDCIDPTASPPVESSDSLDESALHLKAWKCTCKVTSTVLDIIGCYLTTYRSLLDKIRSYGWPRRQRRHSPIRQGYAMRRRRTTGATKRSILYRGRTSRPTVPLNILPQFTAITLPLSKQ